MNASTCSSVADAHSKPQEEALFWTSFRQSDFPSVLVSPKAS
jgi:hypothetical protein